MLAAVIDRITGRDRNAPSALPAELVVASSGWRFCGGPATRTMATLSLFVSRGSAASAWAILPPLTIFIGA